MDLGRAQITGPLREVPERLSLKRHGVIRTGAPSRGPLLVMELRMLAISL